MRKQKNGVWIESAGIYWRSIDERAMFNEFVFRHALKKGPFIARAIMEKIERAQKREEKQDA